MKKNATDLWGVHYIPKEENYSCSETEMDFESLDNHYGVPESTTPPSEEASSMPCKRPISLPGLFISDSTYDSRRRYACHIKY